MPTTKKTENICPSYRATLSPHEHTWTPKEQLEMAQTILRLREENAVLKTMAPFPVVTKKERLVIAPSKTADTRSCDYANVTREQLLASSQQHIEDVGKALMHFQAYIGNAAIEHDYDKISDVDWFLADFNAGFGEGHTSWWDNHRKIHRHHLAQEDGIPDDVNLLDVLEYIADCVMAGKARTGEVFPLVHTPELLATAFENTVTLLSEKVIVSE